MILKFNDFCLVLEGLITEKTEFNLGLPEFLQSGFKNSTTEELFKWCSDNLDHRTFVIDREIGLLSDPKAFTKTLQVKVNPVGLTKLENHLGSLANVTYEVALGKKKTIKVIVDKTDIIKFVESGKKLEAEGSISITTAQQEQITVGIFDNYFNKNITDINDPKNLEVIKGVLPGAETLKDWMLSWESQAIAYKEWMTKNKVNIKSLSYIRDSGIAEAVNNKIKQLGYSSKDSYLPADIFAYNSATVDKHIKQIQSIDTVNKEAGLAYLKAYLIKNLFDFDIIPISLKKSGKVAHVEEFNFDPNEKLKSLTIVKAGLDLNLDEKKNKFTNNGAVLELQDNEGTGYKIFIRSSDSSGTSMVLEAAKKKGALAQEGKVPIDYVRILLKIDTNWKKYAKSFDAFGNLEEAYNFFQKQRLVETGTTISSKEFLAQMERLFNDTATRNKVYVQKVMAIGVLYNLMQMKNYDEVATKLFFGARKQGKEFGPFIKIS